MPDQGDRFMLSTLILLTTLFLPIQTTSACDVTLLELPENIISLQKDYPDVMKELSWEKFTANSKYETLLEMKNAALNKLGLSTKILKDWENAFSNTDLKDSNIQTQEDESKMLAYWGSAYAQATSEFESKLSNCTKNRTKIDEKWFQDLKRSLKTPLVSAESKPLKTFIFQEVNRAKAACYDAEYARYIKTETAYRTVFYQNLRAFIKFLDSLPYEKKRSSRKAIDFLKRYGDVLKTTSLACFFITPSKATTSGAYIASRARPDVAEIFRKKIQSTPGVDALDAIKTFGKVFFGENYD